jgi:outer membrane protein OmpA-like peptidoglycan-associated protein
MESIVIEGHTDTTGKDEVNLPLSQARSMKVVQQSLQALAEQNRSCFLELLSATGRGSVDPIKDQSGRVDLNRSRRVIFKIRVRSLERRIITEVFGNGAAPVVNK